MDPCCDAGDVMRSEYFSRLSSYSYATCGSRAHRLHKPLQGVLRELLGAPGFAAQPLRTLHCTRRPLSPCARRHRPQRLSCGLRTLGPCLRRVVRPRDRAAHYRDIQTSLPRPAACNSSVMCSSTWALHLSDLSLLFSMSVSLTLTQPK